MKKLFGLMVMLLFVVGPIYALDDLDIRDILTPSCGYEVIVSMPTKSGCEYVTFHGVDKDGKPFSVTAQVYIYEGTSETKKAKDISNELNAQSIKIVSSAAKGRAIVQPAAGGKITSAEWDSGSGEEDNELNKLYCDKCQVSASRIKGTSVGLDSQGEPSSIMVGLGNCKVQTYVEPNETPVAILARLKQGLSYLGITAKIGFDADGTCWLVWNNPYRKTRFGSNDLGISHMIVADSLAPTLDEHTVKVTVGSHEVLFVGR